LYPYIAYAWIGAQGPFPRFLKVAIWYSHSPGYTWNRQTKNLALFQGWRSITLSGLSMRYGRMGLIF